MIKNNPTPNINNRMKVSKGDVSHLVIIMGIFILMILFFFILKPNYLSYDNIMTILLATC